MGEALSLLEGARVTVDLEDDVERLSKITHLKKSLEEAASHSP